MSEGAAAEGNPKREAGRLEVVEVDAGVERNGAVEGTPVGKFRNVLAAE